MWSTLWLSGFCREEERRRRKTIFCNSYSVIDRKITIWINL